MNNLQKINDNKLEKIEKKINDIDEKINKIENKKKLLISSKNELVKELNFLLVSKTLEKKQKELAEIIGEDNLNIIKNQFEVK